MFNKYMHLERYGTQEVDGIEVGEVWYDLIKEEMWEIMKKYNQPKVDFKLLQRLTISKIKEIKKDIF